MAEEAGKKKKGGKDRSYHPLYVKKKKVRVKVRLINGKNCFGDCHVLWPDGRTSDVVNDERPFLILTDATVEGEPQVYDVLTVNKEQIEMIFEIHSYEHQNQESPEPKGK